MEEQIVERLVTGATASLGTCSVGGRFRMQVVVGPAARRPLAAGWSVLEAQAKSDRLLEE